MARSPTSAGQRASASGRSVLFTGVVPHHTGTGGALFDIMLFGMTKLSRRQFAGASAFGAAFLAGRSNLLGDPIGLPIGSQTWPVRNMIGKDFDGTLKQLAADGFRAIELCSPPGYKAMGFGPLASMKGSEVKG